MIADIVSPDEELNLISYASEPEDNVQDKSRPRAGEGIERRNATWMTFVSVFSMMYFPLGVGPAFHFTGMIPGVLMLAYSAWSSYVSGKHLSVLCTEDETQIVDTYPKLARTAFGVNGERFVALTQSSLYFMCGVYNIMYMPANFEQLFEADSNSNRDLDEHKRMLYFLITWATMCLGSLLPTFHDTLYIALFSAIVSTVNAFLQLLVVVVYQRELFYRTEKRFFGSNPLRILSALPAISYTFGGHGVFPEEIREMKNPKEFPRVVRWLFAAALPWYFACAIVSYSAYGETIRGNPIENWPEGVWVTKVGALFSLVGALVISVTSNQATLLAIGDIDGEKKTRWNGKGQWYRKFLFVTAQLMTAILLRHVPLPLLQSFMGSFGVGILTFILPFAIYLKRKTDLPSISQLKAAIFLSLGVIFAFVGMLGLNVRGVRSI